MAHRGLSRCLALLCVTMTLAACTTAAPADNDGAQSTDGVLADARRRTTTTKAPATTTTTKPVTTTTAKPATTTTAKPTTTTSTTAAPTTTTPNSSGDSCAQALAKAATNPPRFAPSSTFNRPAACMNDRFDSTTWSDRWFRNATFLGRTDPNERGHINVSFDAYSTPIYDAADATTSIRVFIANWGWGHNLGTDNSIPWNPSWEPAAGNDQEMIILDHTTGREIGLWGVQKINWTSCFTLGNLLNGWRPGVDLCVATATLGKNPDGSIADAKTSSGFSDTAGRGMGAILGMALLPTLDEIEKGSINHALNMETYGTMFGPACTSSQIGTAAAGSDCGYAVAPATRLEWFTGPTDHCSTTNQPSTPAARSQNIPEGMRFALNLSDADIDRWLDRRGYSGSKRSTARIFAVALRDYGWITSDTTCYDVSTAVEGVANPKARTRWAKLGITNPISDGGSLLRGLITSDAQIRTLESPQPDLKVNAF